MGDGPTGRRRCGGGRAGRARSAGKQVFLLRRRRCDTRGDHRGHIELYRIDGTHVHTFSEHTGTVYAVAVTRDGQHIISGSADSRVRVWSVATKSPVSFCCTPSEVRSVAAMPDGKRILVGLRTSVWMLRLDGTRHSGEERKTHH